MYFKEEHLDGTVEYSTIVYEYPKHEVFKGIEQDDI